MYKYTDPVSETVLKKYLGARRPRLQVPENIYQASLHRLQNPGTHDNLAELFNLTPEENELTKRIVVGARRYKRRASKTGSIYQLL